MFDTLYTIMYFVTFYEQTHAYAYVQSIHADFLSIATALAAIIIKNAHAIWIRRMSFGRRDFRVGRGRSANCKC